jgi:hypothetical protein
MCTQVTEEECQWALEATNHDAAHAVKLLRLKSLLPDTILEDGVEDVVSALEMSHYDVGRAHGFLLDRDKARSKGSTNGKSKSRSGRSEYSSSSSFVCNENFSNSASKTDNSNNNNSHNGSGVRPEFNDYYSSAMLGTSGTTIGDAVNNEHIRPTRV